MFALLLLTHLALPLGLLLWIAFLPAPSRAGFWVQAGATLLGLVMLKLGGIWLFPPWWVADVYLVALLALVGLAWRRRRPAPPWPARWAGWCQLVAFLALGAGSGFAIGQCLMGRSPPASRVVNLAFPFRGGTYMIVQGGGHPLLNNHLAFNDPAHRGFAQYRGISHAVDLVKLDRGGFRARGIAPPEPADYAIYGEPVLAPCAGIVIVVESKFPDLQVPLVDPVNKTGNHVIIRTAEADIVLAHFRRGTLAIKPGDRVVAGQYLGQVGNSGNSTEPHLHLHAQRPGTADAPLGGDPLPVRLDGRYPVRNNRISPQP
jgi:Peptidase family M23